MTTLNKATFTLLATLLILTQASRVDAQSDPIFTAAGFQQNRDYFSGVPGEYIGAMQVVVAGNPLYATDRVEIWADGTSTPVVPARYLNGQTTPPTALPVEGSFTMTGPAAPGLYTTVVLRRGENPNAPATPAAYGPSLLVSNGSLNGIDTQF